MDPRGRSPPARAGRPGGSEPRWPRHPARSHPTSRWAAAGQGSVHSVVAYSPGFGAEYPPGALDRIGTAIRESDPDAAIRLVFREVIGMPPEDIQVLADSEVWQVRVAAAWSVVRECQADEAFLRVSGAVLAGISQPVQFLSGERNVPAKRELAAALANMIPGAVLDDLSGEGHAAHHTSPAALASRCLRFFDEVAGRATASGEPAAATGAASGQ